MSERYKVLLLGGFAAAIGVAVCLAGLDVIPVDPGSSPGGIQFSLRDTN